MVETGQGGEVFLIEGQLELRCMESKKQVPQNGCIAWIWSIWYIYLASGVGKNERLLSPNGVFFF